MHLFTASFEGFALQHEWGKDCFYWLFSFSFCKAQSVHTLDLKGSEESCARKQVHSWSCVPGVVSGHMVQGRKDGSKWQWQAEIEKKRWMMRGTEGWTERWQGKIRDDGVGRDGWESRRGFYKHGRTNSTARIIFSCKSVIKSWLMLMWRTCLGETSWELDHHSTSL